MEAVPALANARDMIDEIENCSSHLLTALESGQLSPGGIITEGSASSTSISIAMFYAQQEKNPGIKCILIDPPGSSLYNKVTRGVTYTKEEVEGRRLKNPFDTIIEGIRINRITRNFAKAKLDGAFRGTDLEAVEMARFLLPEFIIQGIFCITNLIAGHWVIFLIGLPCMYYNVRLLGVGVLSNKDHKLEAEKTMQELITLVHNAIVGLMKSEDLLAKIGLL
ncbi:hypothetical protein S83_058901, partial [Arachis hypogaea]